MTAKTKRSLTAVLLLMTGIFLTIMVLTVVGWIGRAMASTSTAVQSPSDTMVQIYHFMKNGENLPAVGAALMLIVWLLRWGHTKLPAPLGPWFQTKLGGYVLGFGTSALLHFSVTLMAGQGVTLGLFIQAFGTGFAAAGAWEGLRDLITNFRTKPIVVTLFIAIVASSCGPIKRESARVANDAVDCTVGDLASLQALVPMILPQLGTKPDWKMIGAQLEGAGARVATCVMHSLIERWISNIKFATPEGKTEADAAFAELKAKLGVRVVKTTSGDK